MRDAIIRAGWRWAVLTMILVAGLLCLSLSYRAFCGLVEGQWPDAATLLGVSILAGLFVYWLCEHRIELVEF